MIRDLTIEYRKNPIGIDEKPRFSWKLESEKQDVVQTLPDSGCQRRPAYVGQRPGEKRPIRSGAI